MDSTMSSEERNAVVRMAFESVSPMLARFDGGGAARRMEELWNEDRVILNGVYWKCDKWLRDFMASKDHTLRDGGEDHSGAAVVEFVRDCYPDRLDGQWRASELPYLMQRLSAYSRKPIQTHHDPF